MDPVDVRIRRQGITSTTNETAAVITRRNLTSGTIGVYSCWTDAICYMFVLGHIHAGRGNVAATSGSRTGWSVRT